MSCLLHLGMASPCNPKFCQHILHPRGLSAFLCGKQDRCKVSSGQGNTNLSGSNFAGACRPPVQEAGSVHHVDAPVALLETSVLQGQVDEAAMNSFFTECIQRRYFPGQQLHVASTPRMSRHPAEMMQPHPKGQALHTDAMIILSGPTVGQRVVTYANMVNIACTGCQRHTKKNSVVSMIHVAVVHCLSNHL